MHRDEVIKLRAEVASSKVELDKYKLLSHSAGGPNCSGWESHAEASLLKDLQIQLKDLMKKVEGFERDRDAAAQRMKEIINERNAEWTKIPEETLDENTFKVNDLFTQLELCQNQLALKTEELEQYEYDAEDVEADADAKSVMTFKIDTPPSVHSPSVTNAKLSDVLSALDKASARGYDIRQDILARRAGIAKFSYANVEGKSQSQSAAATPVASGAGGEGPPTPSVTRNARESGRRTAG
jgi:chromosome segregation ATPase